MVFPTFFNLRLNFPIRSSGSEPQSAPGLVFADCIELLHVGWIKPASPALEGGSLTTGLLGKSPHGGFDLPCSSSWF